MIDNKITIDFNLSKDNENLDMIETLLQCTVQHIRNYLKLYDILDLMKNDTLVLKDIQMLEKRLKTISKLINTFGQDYKNVNEMTKLILLDLYKFIE